MFSVFFNHNFAYARQCIFFFYSKCWLFNFKSEQKSKYLFTVRRRFEKMKKRLRTPLFSLFFTYNSAYAPYTKMLIVSPM